MTDIALSDRQIVTVCDREADVYELFQYSHDQHLDFIVRSVRHRRLEDGPLLRDHLGELSPVATYTLSVQRQVNQTQRQAQVDLRYTTVTLRPPKREIAARVMSLAPLTVQVVEVREVEPPAEVQEPLHWILLTTLPVVSPDDAYRIVR